MFLMLGFNNEKSIPVLRIRIRIQRIHMILVLLDTDPDPISQRYGSFYHSANKVRKPLIPTAL
jgi:hypothetical protein